MSNMRCAICGSKKAADDKSPAICQYFCYWTLEGWLGWNGRTRKVAIRDARAMAFVPDRLSYPKTIRAARTLGWMGEENAVGTFVQVQPKTFAAKAGA
jgi:hypothetical protein